MPRHTATGTITRSGNGIFNPGTDHAALELTWFKIREIFYIFSVFTELGGKVLRLIPGNYCLISGFQFFIFSFLSLPQNKVNYHFLNINLEIKQTGRVRIDMI